MPGLACSKTLITSLNAASSDPVNAPRIKTLPVSAPTAGAIDTAGGAVAAGVAVGCSAGAAVDRAGTAVAPVTPPPGARMAVGAAVARVPLAPGGKPAVPVGLELGDHGGNA